MNEGSQDYFIVKKDFIMERKGTSKLFALISVLIPKFHLHLGWRSLANFKKKSPGNTNTLWSDFVFVIPIPNPKNLEYDSRESTIRS